MADLNVKQLVLGSFRANCYIVYNDAGEALIVDPGDSYMKIKDTIVEMKLSPKAILLTHGHFDHIGAAAKLREVYGIKIYAHEDERQIMTVPDYNLSNMCGVPFGLEADVYVKGDQVIDCIGMDIKVMHTPGHTSGSCCYYFEKYSTLFSGDTLFYQSHGRYDFPTGSAKQIMESITGKLFGELSDDVVVLPGHNGDTTIGDEKQWYR